VRESARKRRWEVVLCREGPKKKLIKAEQLSCQRCVRPPKKTDHSPLPGWPRWQNKTEKQKTPFSSLSPLPSSLKPAFSSPHNSAQVTTTMPFFFYAAAAAHSKQAIAHGGAWTCMRCHCRYLPIYTPVYEVYLILLRSTLSVNPSHQGFAGKRAGALLYRYALLGYE
jgi:hypothetical protein